MQFVIVSLTAATGVYFFLARWLQDNLLPVDRTAALHKLSTFEVLPEPWEIPLYFAAYLVIPIIAFALYPGIKKLT